MILKTQLFGKTYQFRDLREVMAKANEEKSGDRLAGIAAADFTEEALKAAGMVEGTHYYNLVNEDNAWVSENGTEQTGTWYGTLYNIRDFKRAFSAVGYVTVTYNGVTFTLYGGYTDDCSRTVAYVAEKAMEGEVIGESGNWNAQQEAILASFYQG